MLYLEDVIVILISYLLGSVTVGYYLVHFRTGKDIRNIGSGSVGARNVGRLLGSSGYGITFAGDLVKGALAVSIASLVGLSTLSQLAVVIAVVAGHIWPIQLGFRGGKGIATVIGALFVFDYLLAFVLLGIAGVLFTVTRRFTLSGLIAIALSPAASFALGYSMNVVLGITTLVLVILIAHRTNVGNMIRLLRRQTSDSEPR